MSDSAPDDTFSRERLWRIIFRSDTPGGRRFDVALLWLIALSVLTLTLESVDELRASHAMLFLTLEWTFTILFTIEYLLRLWVVRNRWQYSRSFLGIVDLLSILPTYLSLLVPGTHYLMNLRILRLMRMFRILKMTEYLGEASILLNALSASRRKITVFLASVLTLVFLEGTVMYVLEQGANPDFANIPQSIYWAIVTVTTVGYGDVAPVTVPGKMMASVIMMTGFAILAVPTGIMSYEIGREIKVRRGPPRRCRECGWTSHSAVARYCEQCGTGLEPD